MKEIHIPIEKIIKTFEIRFKGAGKKIDDRLKLIDDRLKLCENFVEGVGYYPDADIPYWNYTLGQKDPLIKRIFISHIQNALVKEYGLSMWGKMGALIEIILDLIVQQQENEGKGNEK